jgi:Brp/Blh family beta-carotene 15,15'-monooxygenase
MVSDWLPTSLPPDLTLVVVLLVLVLGVPHGALDPVLAGRWLKEAGPGRWVIFLSGYCLLVGAAIALWWWSESVFLLGFLLVSAHHFSEDLPGAPLWRWVHGGSVILLPSVLHTAELSRLLLLIAPATPEAALQAFPVLAWPCAGLALWDTARMARNQWSTAAARSLLLASLVLLPPLLSFALYFCLWHAPVHVLRLRTKPLSWTRRLVMASAACAVLTVGASAASWWWLGWQDIPAALVTSLFVGLGALTLPHWLLVSHFQREALRG